MNLAQGLALGSMNTYFVEYLSEVRAVISRSILCKFYRLQNSTRAQRRC